MTVSFGIDTTEDVSDIAFDIALGNMQTFIDAVWVDDCNKCFAGEDFDVTYWSPVRIKMMLEAGYPNLQEILTNAKFSDEVYVKDMYNLAIRAIQLNTYITQS